MCVCVVLKYKPFVIINYLALAQSGLRSDCIDPCLDNQGKTHPIASSRNSLANQIPTGAWPGAWLVDSVVYNYIKDTIADANEVLSTFQNTRLLRVGSHSDRISSVECILCSKKYSNGEPIKITSSGKAESSKKRRREDGFCSPECSAAVRAFLKGNPNIREIVVSSKKSHSSII